MLCGESTRLPSVTLKSRLTRDYKNSLDNCGCPDYFYVIGDRLYSPLKCFINLVAAAKDVILFSYKFFSHSAMSSSIPGVL